MVWINGAIDNIFMIFWEGIKLVSVLCVLSVTLGFNKHFSSLHTTMAQEGHSPVLIFTVQF